MSSIPVNLANTNYQIHIREGLLKDPESGGLLPLAKHYCIVTHKTIADLYLSHVLKLLPGDSKQIIIELDEGETAKSAENYLSILDKCLNSGFNRNSVLIALGGGVVGDLTGFVASTLHRGCQYVQVPTSLLAQVDSSVGGKTAINHVAGKNLIGSFYQPAVVLIDTSTLQTLPEREFSAGMAEVIKYSLIRDSKFMFWLMEHKEQIKSLHMPTLVEMISCCCDIKADIVHTDEKEMGIRAVLNLGHTFGHAIEHQMGYGKLLHGEAVSIGLLMACQLSEKILGISHQITHNLKKLLEYFKLPVNLPATIDTESMIDSMMGDKKNKDSGLTLILPKDYGQSEIIKWEDLDSLKAFIKSYPRED